MKSVNYYYKNLINKKPPSNNSEYLTLFNFVPGYSDLGDIFNYFENHLKNNLNKKIILVAQDEGYYGSYIDGLYKDNVLDFINKWVVENKLEKKNVYFISNNLISDKIVEKQKYQFNAIGALFNSESYLLNEKNILDLIEYRFQKNTIEKKFLSYNRNFKPHRFYLQYKLIETNIIDSGLFFYHAHNFDMPYVKTITEKYSHYFDLNVLNKINLEQTKYSEKFDDEPLYGQKIIYSDYNKTFMSLVTETESGNDTVYFSEKTFKPISTLHPFILISSPNSLTYLKNIGYKTFDKWWDESYDECNNFFDRVNKVIDILHDLSKLSNEKLFEMRLEMREVLEHNYNLYQSRIKKDFLLDALNSIFIDK